MTDITFSKGSLSVGVYSDEVNEEYNNKLIVLSLAQTSSNQASGKKDTKILDLLRITHQFVIKAYFVKESTVTAKTQKTNLFSIANGGGTNGGTTSMVFDGDTYNGYIEKINCKTVADDSVNETSDQVRKYELTITFVVGVAI